MKGEPIRQPSELKLDVPTDAYLPKDYVTKEELRLEAYRRLAGVTTPSEVDDIRAEWEDRYGPVPAAAASLLDVAYLRAECHRLGITEVTIAGASSSSNGQARLAPVDLKVSEGLRLKRIAKTAIHKEDQRQLVVPIPQRSEPSVFLTGFLRELFPDPNAAPADPPAGRPTVSSSGPSSRPSPSAAPARRR